MSQDAPSTAGSGVPFGRYALRRRLAKGGMGEVFLADQLGPRGPVRPVALKRMLPKLAGERRVAQKFLDEMAILAQLNHPNIATTYDFGEVEGVYFLAMEYIEGLSLKQLFEALGPLPVGAALAIAQHTAHALDFAHGHHTPRGESRPVVHRDVSPHNILVSVSGAVKLLDFGIAGTEAVIEGGPVVGKLAYAAPEHLAGGPPDRRSDLWALGVVLFESLAGVRPFEQLDSAALLQATHRRQYSRLSQLRPEAAEVEPIIARALEPDPQARWPSAAAFARACAEKLPKFGQNDAASLARLVLQAGGPPKVPLGTELISSPDLLVINAPTLTVPLPAAELLIPKLAAKKHVLSEADTIPDRSAPRRSFPWITLLAAAVLIAFAAGSTVFSRPKQDPPAPANPAPAQTQIQEIEPVEAPVEAPVLPENPEPTPEPPTHVQPKPTPAPAMRRRASVSSRRRTVEAQKAAPADPAKVVLEPGPPATAAAPNTPTSPSVDPGLGLLSIRVIPYARVHLGDRDLGNSPLANVPVPAGSHRLRLEPSSKEHALAEIEISVRAGVVTRVLYDFTSGKKVVR